MKKNHHNCHNKIKKERVYLIIYLQTKTRIKMIKLLVDLLNKIHYKYKIAKANLEMKKILNKS